MNYMIQVVKLYLEDNKSVSKEELKQNHYRAGESLALARIVADAARSAYFSKRNESHDLCCYPDEDGCDAKRSIQSYNKLLQEVNK